jgi:hypothetical protein
MNYISKGIDISRWQGDFNMKAAVKEGIKFVIVKGGGGDDGLYKDSKFEANYKNAKANSLPVGVYWFSKALTVAEATKEADYFYNNILKGKKFELPVYIDVENKTQLAVGKRNLTEIVKAWCERLEKLGYWVGIYSSASYFSSYMYDNELTGYAHWVAQWAKSCTYKNTSCLGVWQFGGETNLICSNKVAGVTCDQDYLIIDYPTLIKNAGRNGYSKVTTAQTTTSSTTKNSAEKKASNFSTGEIVNFAGGKHYTAANATSGSTVKGSLAKITSTSANSKHPLHLRAINDNGTYINGVYGWVDLSTVSKRETKSIDTVAREVIAGKWGNGTDRKNKLTAAGYDYAAVQKRVNELIK